MDPGLVAELERVYNAWETAEAERQKYPHMYRYLDWAETWAATVSPAYFSGSHAYRWLQGMGRDPLSGPWHSTGRDWESCEVPRIAKSSELS